MPTVVSAPTPNCRWGFITTPRPDGRLARTLVWICEYPYRTIRTAPSDDCEGCLRAMAASDAPMPHLDEDVRELERMMKLVS